MAYERVKAHSVAFAGSLLGLASIPFGWLSLRPSRLAAGASLKLWEAYGAEAGLIIALWVSSLVLSLTGRGKAQSLALGAVANSILVLSLAIAGAQASHLLQGQPDYARISLGAGTWISLAAAGIVIYSARQALENGPGWQKSLVSWTGLASLAGLAALGWFNDLSIARELMGQEPRFLQELARHVLLFASSVSIGAAIGIPLGIWAIRSRRVERPVLYFANIVQTIPSLALFGFLIGPLAALSFAYPTLREAGIRGVGIAPALIALTIYSLLPIVKNTYVGFRQVDPAIIDAGRGVGMNRGQLFRRLELPLAAPLVLEGVRTAAVQAVGLATVAALIGAGGLGTFIFQGVGQAADDLILLGALPVIGLALVVDGLMRVAVRQATPKGLRKAWS